MKNRQARWSRQGVILYFVSVRIVKSPVAQVLVDSVRCLARIDDYQPLLALQINLRWRGGLIGGRCRLGKRQGKCKCHRYAKRNESISALHKSPPDIPL